MTPVRAAASASGVLATRPWLAPLAAAVVFGLAVVAISARGAPGPLAATATVAQIWIESGGVALAWLLGALGLGRLVRPALKNGAGAWSAQLGVGVAIMLCVAHGLGALGGYSGRAGMFIAWAPVAAGAALLFDQIRRREHRPELWGAMPLTSLIALPGVAALIVAACNPPGTLWSSEARGYDTLSYHLELPREWLERGRIQPFEHNVYSFFPSYVESAFTQMGAMMSAGAGAFTGAAGSGLYAAQCLHALLALCAAAVIGRFIAMLAADCGAEPPIRQFAAGAGGATFLATPWIVVTGSMAYNEMAVVLSLAAAMLVARRAQMRPVARGAIVGLITGAAVGAKLTALYLVIPVTGLALITWSPRRTWIASILAAAGAGALVITPWLLRNAPCGNPLFPFGTELLGAAHWTPEQVARWKSAHFSGASVIDRLALLISVERGALHPQWFLFFPACIGAIGAALAFRRTRVLAASLGAMGGLQLLLWMCVGHLQSRFLLPAATVGAVLIGLGAVAALMQGRLVGRLGALLVIAIALGLSASSVLNFMSQNGGRPNAALVGGVPAINGALAADALPLLSPGERRDLLDSLSPAAIVNLALERRMALRNVAAAPTPRLYMFGDATPLYFHVPTTYHTTWDTSPLAELLRTNGGDLPGAIASLRDGGVTHMLVNLDEVARLRADGWSDPLLTPELAQRVLDSAGVIVWTWRPPGGAGSALIDLSRAPGEPPSEPR